MAYKPNLQRNVVVASTDFSAPTCCAKQLCYRWSFCSAHCSAGVYSLTSADAFIAWQGFMAKPWLLCHSHAGFAGEFLSLP